MFGGSRRQCKPIAVGRGGPTLFVGPRRSKCASAICDKIGEYLYDVAYAVLFKFGGFDEEEFEAGLYGKYIGVQRCTDASVKNYIQNVVIVARDALKQNKLRTFEVSIVDGVDLPLATFSVHFRRQPRFRDCSLRGNEKAMEELVDNLGRTLQNIHKIALSDEMLAKVQQTESRLQIRLQVSEDFVEMVNDVMEADSKAALLTEASFLPWSDPVTNMFNQLFFTSSIVCDPTPSS